MSKKVPKYESIKNYLIMGIAARNFTDALPSENQLADKFNVSRMTARRALSELERNGSVERIPGKGTFVRDTAYYTSGFFRVRPFQKWAEDIKAKLTTRVLQSQIIDPPRAIADKLQFDGQTILLKILNCLDDKPVRYAIHHLRADQCAGIIWEDLQRQSIHHILINKYRLPLTRISQEMTAIALPESLSSLFHAPAGHPMFHFERLTFSFDTPITHVQYFMRGEMAFKDTFAPHLDRADFESQRRDCPLPDRLVDKRSS